MFFFKPPPPFLLQKYSIYEIMDPIFMQKDSYYPSILSLFHEFRVLTWRPGGPIKENVSFMLIIYKYIPVYLNIRISMFV